MVRLNEDGLSIVVSDTFSWDYVKKRIQEVKDYWTEYYEADELADVDAAHVEELLNWDPEDEEHQEHGTKADIMQYVADRMRDDECLDFFRPEQSIENSLIEWLSGEFGIDMEDRWIYPDRDVE